MPAGYSGTPLAKKLGIKAGHSVATVNEPAEFRGLLVDLPDDVDLTGDVVRASVLATKLVDVKVCAISDTWSGLKVVWRQEHG
jgi:hypothetical protein